MKKIILTLFLLFSILCSTGMADTISGEISSKIADAIPGDGITEVSVKIKDEKDDTPDFSILGVRDLSSRDNSNFFTQFSLGNTDVNNDDRIIGNLGFGYRTLTPDENFMFGINTFYDRELKNEHERISLGIEAKGSILDISANKYQKISNMIIVNGSEEQVLSGWDANVSTQIPHMPWALLNVEGYKYKAEKAKKDTRGLEYSLEMNLTPTIQFDISVDDSLNDGVEDVYAYNLSFIYPPKEKKHTLKAGLLSENPFEKESMQKKLKDKVRRNNKPVIEIQGSVIVTSK
tara:strand:- start:755 stop:1624 length:870 start_codon:yes stop_codon:yes gene_type:complete